MNLLSLLLVATVISMEHRFSLYYISGLLFLTNILVAAELYDTVNIFMEDLLKLHHWKQVIVAQCSGLYDPPILLSVLLKCLFPVFIYFNSVSSFC